MSFHDVVLPPGLQYGSASGAGLATIVQETASGHEVRIARQAQGRHRMSLVKALQTSAEAKALKAFALGRRGALHSFKVTDVSDFTTHPDGESAHAAIDSHIGTGDSTSTGPFQLLKVYPDAANPYPRVLTLPVSGTVLVALDGTPTSAFTVNGEGQVTLNSAPANGVLVTAGCQFYVPVRFSQGFDEWAALQADAFDTWSLPQLDVVEVLNEVESPERHVPNGGRDWGQQGASVRVSLNDGCLQLIEPTAAISMFLPAPTRCPGGSEVFVVHVKTGSAGSVQVRDDTGTAIGAAITAGQQRTIGLAADGAGGVAWVVG